jgi:hypothetical protein
MVSPGHPLLAGREVWLPVSRLEHDTVDGVRDRGGTIGIDGGPGVCPGRVAGEDRRPENENENEK